MRLTLINDSYQKIKAKSLFSFSLTQGVNF